MLLTPVQAAAAVPSGGVTAAPAPSPSIQASGQQLLITSLEPCTDFFCSPAQASQPVQLIAGEMPCQLGAPSGLLDAPTSLHCCRLVLIITPCVAAGQQYLVEVRHWQWGGAAHVALAAITPSSVTR